MASLEWRVLSEILRSKNFAVAVETGLKSEHFKDLEMRQIFVFVKGFYESRDTPKQVPLIETVKKRWPSFMMTATSDGDEGAISLLIKELKLAALSSDLDAMARQFVEQVQDDPEEALKAIRNQIANVTYSHESKGGFGMKEIAQGVREQYQGASHGLNHGIPWPWEGLDRDTRGKRKGNLIVIYGRMKSMKTWILLYNACHDYIASKRRVLVWSKEMDEDDMKLRLGSIIAKVDYQALAKGCLPNHLVKSTLDALDKAAEIMSHTPADLLKAKDRTSADIVVLSGRNAPRSLPELRALIDMWRPDICYIDSFYHLESDRASGKTPLWQKILMLAEELKWAATDFRIPIVLAGQANREGEKTAGETMIDVAGADRLSAEADLILKVLKRKGPDLYEEAYEKAWEEEAKAFGRRDERAARPSIKIPMNGRAAHARVNGSPVPTKARRREGMPLKRTSAELAIMLAGNREGTKEGFTLRCTPGYDWEVTREDVTPSEVKELFKEALAQPPGQQRGGGGGNKRRETNGDPNAPESFAFRGLKTE